MNHTPEQVQRWYDEDLRRAAGLTAEQRLTMSLQLFEMSRNLMRDRLREEFPAATPDELKTKLRERIHAMRECGRAA